MGIDSRFAQQAIGRISKWESLDSNLGPQFRPSTAAASASRYSSGLAPLKWDFSALDVRPGGGGGRSEGGSAWLSPAPAPPLGGGAVTSTNQRALGAGGGPRRCGSSPQLERRERSETLRGAKGSEPAPQSPSPPLVAFSRSRTGTM